MSLSPTPAEAKAHFVGPVSSKNGFALGTNGAFIGELFNGDAVVLTTSPTKGSFAFFTRKTGGAGGSLEFYNSDAPSSGEVVNTNLYGYANENTFVSVDLAKQIVTALDVTAASEGARVDLSVITAGSQVVVRSESGQATAIHVPTLVKTTVTTDSTAGAKTYTADEWLGGLILRDPNGSGRSDVSPTAAALVAAVPGAAVGDSFEVIIRNTADAAETITLTAATAAVTLSGTMTIAQNNTKRFRVVFTDVTASSEAVTVYSLGTLVH